MTVSYRNRFTSYKQETDGQYAPVGSIVSVLVDNFSDAAQSPEYGYKNYLYCDGRELNIRDYPFLYRSVGNTYGGSPAVEKTQPTQAGGVTKLYWINGKAFFNLLSYFFLGTSLKEYHEWSTTEMESSGIPSRRSGNYRRCLCGGDAESKVTPSSCSGTSIETDRTS